MAITFKSSTPEERVLLIRDRDGGERICTAVQDHANTNNWKLKLTHSSGMTWKGSFNGRHDDLNLAMDRMISDKESDYLQEKARGHRPPPGDRDTNVRIDNMGADTTAPITQRWR
jgi:hypothetical protein